MKLLEMSDSQINTAVAPILKDVIVGSRNKDWALFSKYMASEDASSAEAKADVEAQWEENEYLTSFADEFEFLGVIRKTDIVLVICKLTCTNSEDEYLEKLYLEEQDGEIVTLGIFTE